MGIFCYFHLQTFQFINVKMLEKETIGGGLQHDTWKLVKWSNTWLVYVPLTRYIGLFLVF